MGVGGIDLSVTAAASHSMVAAARLPVTAQWSTPVQPGSADDPSTLCDAPTRGHAWPSKGGQVCRRLQVVQSVEDLARRLRRPRDTDHIQRIAFTRPRTRTAGSPSSAVMTRGTGSPPPAAAGKASRSRTGAAGDSVILRYHQNSIERSDENGGVLAIPHARMISCPLASTWGQPIEEDLPERLPQAILV